MEEIIFQRVEQYLPGDETEYWDLRGLSDWVNVNFPTQVDDAALAKVSAEATELPVAGSMYDGLAAGPLAVCRHITQRVRDAYELKINTELGSIPGLDQEQQVAALTSMERWSMLEAIDRLWREHLYAMDSLRSSIGLRAYGQKDPLIEYKVEAKDMFDELMANIKSEICRNIFRTTTSQQAFEDFNRTVSYSNAADTDQAGFSAQLSALADEAMADEEMEEAPRATPVRAGPKVGRNDPCPCGSGKKYKKCCGR